MTDKGLHRGQVPWNEPTPPQSPTDSSQPIGPDGPVADGLLALMRAYSIPISREAYLELAYMGEPPNELSAEEEMNLPLELRKL
jgi:hypothetical protein